MTPELKEVWPGQSVELLKELHLLTRDGQLNQDSRRKLKQVLHFFQFLKKDLDFLSRDVAHFTIADLGAGKSYLSFILYDLWARNHESVQLYGIETRAELVAKCEAIAQKENFTRIRFLKSSIEEARSAESLPKKVNAVIALHACDTATDDAIHFALQKEAELIALVPCCQAEVANSLKGLARDEIYALWRHPLHRREFGSHLSNVIRGLYLESHGYEITVTELLGWEHSLKNELILAKKIQNKNKLAGNQLEALLKKIPVEMKLLQPRSLF